MNDILIVAGSPRSGTTFIGSTLNAHSQISLFSEFSMTDIYRSLDQMFISSMDENSDISNSLLSPPFLRPIQKDYNEIFKSIFGHIYPHKSATIFGTKMPAIATKEDIDYLLARQPRPKLVYVLRNCNFTVASSMRRYEATIQGKDNWLYESETKALNEWLYSLFIGKYMAKRTEVLFVKYEDVIANQKNEAERISTFLGIDAFNFAVSNSTRDIKILQQTLSAYPRELLELVENWEGMSIDQIVQRPLASVQKYMCGDWQSMGIALCDIGTHINFNKPEPWGAWSKAGFFGLKPRFMRTDAALAAVELEFLENQKRIERLKLAAFSGSKPLSVSILDESESTTLVKISMPPSTRVGEDRPVISVFFERWVHSERDPRQLGLPLSRYRLTWNENGSH
jgi:hypothetical protein